MSDHIPTTIADHLQDEDSNQSGNPAFEAVLHARLSRRQVMLGATAAAATVASGSAAARPWEWMSPPTHRHGPKQLLGFKAVSKSIADQFTVPEGYTATVLCAVGDPLIRRVGAHRNDGTDTDFDQRVGEWHDGMEYFGLSLFGTPNPQSCERALLAINHEWVSQEFLHVNGPSGSPRPASEVDIEIEAMGVSIVEIKKGRKDRFEYVKDSRFNRRITTMTEIEMAGPARGHAKLVTRFSPQGLKTRGTINNCGTGKTPWGTLLTGEENWTNFFFRAAGDDAKRSPHENYALARYGRSVSATAAAVHVYGWNTVTAPGKFSDYARWDTSVKGSSSDGRDDHRHEINAQGYVTEVDPYDPRSVVKKRTALGRMAHEGAAFSTPVRGQPLAIYMGDDARGEYIYKFVTEAVWDPLDAFRADRMKVGDKYLNRGKLYAAKFNADGSGEWVELSINNPAIAGYDKYKFADQGDVVIHARIAADAAGATRMDRPEWGATNPANGEVYITLTNNTNRRASPSGSQLGVDAANPRAYEDTKGSATVNRGNVNGHIVRMKDARRDPAATRFTWDIYLFGAESDADPRLVNLSGLTDDQDFSSPDGLVFTGSTGLCWIQTDDDYLTDESNCMMLAAVPGKVGDGTSVTLDHGTTTVTTYVGAKPTASTLKRFLVGPKGQEITGLAETPDGKVMFVNVQHPEGNWPANSGYGAGGASGRPRSATVMITKNDGGRIGT